MKCCFCNRVIKKVGNWDQGNNAEPLYPGRCCDSCNNERVIPARLENIKIGDDKNVEN